MCLQFSQICRQRRKVGKKNSRTSGEREPRRSRRESEPNGFHHIHNRPSFTRKRSRFDTNEERERGRQRQRNIERERDAERERERK